jgi:hypothetical protein
VKAGLLSTLKPTIALLCLLVAAALPAAAVEVDGRSTVISWPVSSGPVAGYYVLVYRNGSKVPELPFGVTNPVSRVYAVTGRKGDQVRVRVAAFDAEGTIGPLSPRSEKIFFLGGSRGSGGSTAPGDGASSEIPNISTRSLPTCADEMLVVGQDKLKVRGEMKERGATALRGVLCNQEWRGIAVGNTIWGGRFERIGKKKAKSRKLRLEPDAGTTEAILAAIGRRVAEQTDGAWTLELRKPPEMHVKANRDRDKVRWRLDVKLELTNAETGKVRRGRYRFGLRGALSSELASALWP